MPLLARELIAIFASISGNDGAQLGPRPPLTFVP